MAVGNFTVYSAAVQNMGQATFNFVTDTFNVILLTTSYIPSVHVDSIYSDVLASEAAASGGYTAGGITLTGVTWSRLNGVCTMAAQSAVWAGSTIAARYAVIVRRASGTLAGTDKLLGYMDLNTGGGNVSSTANTFQVNWNGSTPSAANTVFTFTHTP